MNTIPVEKFVQENYERVQERIMRAAQAAGREPSDIRLTVVTKGHHVTRIQAVIEAGARVLGENYVEEAIQKIEALKHDSDISWHMIGHVQSRKARLVCQYFDYVHSVDSLKLARRLSRFAAEMDRTLPILLECNVSGEESKFGFPATSRDHWPGLLPVFNDIIQLSNIEVRGLMTMPPYFADPELARPYFVNLRHLRDYLKSNFPHLPWSELSMGMSSDYEVAIQEGATILRIGQAILGPRY